MILNWSRLPFVAAAAIALTSCESAPVRVSDCSAQAVIGLDKKPWVRCQLRITNTGTKEIWATRFEDRLQMQSAAPIACIGVHDDVHTLLPGSSYVLTGYYGVVSPYGRSEWKALAQPESLQCKPFAVTFMDGSIWTAKLGNAALMRGDFVWRWYPTPEFPKIRHHLPRNRMRV